MTDARGLLAAAGVTASAVAVAGAATLAYGALVEARDFQIRRERLAILPPGAESLRILHLSDIHLMPEQSAKLEWLSTLHTLEPDLVVNTGDNIGSGASISPLLEALGPLLAVPGVFVPGSNDYFAPRPANPLRYFAGPSKPVSDPQELPWRDLFAAFTTSDWVDLTDAQHTQVLNGLRLDWAGTDDPHLGWDHWPSFAQGSAGARGSAGADHAERSLAIGVTHAPYRRVLDAMVEDGADLIFAGHTHGGQICLPFYGALVTNCDLPTSQASGLSTWTRSGDTVPLEVSAGIGAAPKFPVRIACKPEAVVMDLVAAGS